MIFSSNVFILYFLPIFLGIYYLTPQKFRNYPLLLASIFFYAYGAPDFIIQFLALMVANFYIVKFMHHVSHRVLKYSLCAVSLLLSLGTLFYYKYGNFTMENLNSILGWFHQPPIFWRHILLPIGISFFTFQNITYTLDTYRGVNAPMSKLSDYMLYICMFPQLVAGPIIRYCDIAEQIRNREAPYSERLHGFYRFILGLAKKVIIADTIGFQVDKVLGPANYDLLSSEQLTEIASQITQIDSGTAWIVILAYTFQLYFDFSGYSDMAIGLGRMLGFKFPENFDNPYVSTSISEFWRRWHQTFSVFMKNYLYIPLGGSRVKSKYRKYFNLWICFLLSGLWHGSAWNFVIYGALQGIFICADKLFLVKFLTKLGKIPSVIFTFLIIVLTRCFFRIERVDLSWTFLKRLFAFDFGGCQITENPHFYFTMGLAAFFSFVTLTKWGKKWQDCVYFSEYSKGGHVLATLLAIFGFIFCLGGLNASGFSPFIYFRF